MISTEAWDEYGAAEATRVAVASPQLRGVVAEFRVRVSDRSLPQGTDQDGVEDEFVRSYDTAELFTAMWTAGVESLLDEWDLGAPAADVVRPQGAFSEDWDAILSLPVRAAPGGLSLTSSWDDELEPE